MYDAFMTPAPVAPPQPAPLGIPLLAAAMTLLGPVIGFVIFITQVAGAPADYGDSGTDEGLARAWNEGGWPMYAALTASMFLAFFSALFVFFAARRSAALAIGIPFFAVIPAAIGGAGTNWGLQGAMEAVAHVAPADRTTILCAALKEALWTTTFGASLSAGACIALALSLLIASRAQRDAHRQALTLGGLLFGGFTVLAILGAITSRAVGDAYGLIAYTSHNFMVDGMLELVLGFQRWQGFTAGAALVLVIAILAAAALFKAPAAGRASFLIAAMFSALLLFVSVRSKVSSAFQEAVSAPSNFTERFKFDAPETREGDGPEIDDPFDDDAMNRLGRDLLAFRDLHEAAGDKVDSATLSLRPGVKADGLARALRSVAMERYGTVTLLTDPTQRQVTPLLPPPFDLVSQSPHGLKLKLAFRDDSCREDCELAKLNAATLTVRDVSWPLEHSAKQQLDGEPLFLEIVPIEPAQLLSAIATASKHQRTLTLLFENSVFDDTGDLDATLGNVPPPPPPPPPKKKK